MPVIPQDRPIETLRKETIDQLIMNYSHGEISLAAFERRLDDAMETTDHSVLVDLTSDLDLMVDQEFVNNKKQQMGMNYTPGETEEVEHIFQIFGGNDRSGVWRLPKEIHIVSIFSGANIDLTQAQFTSPVVRITVFNLFSGDNIYVPENVNVHSKAFCIFGGIKNNVNSSADPDAPTIIIEGFALFSGIDIKIKRTVKENFMIFADKLKSLLS